ncbi:hypothetical protein NY414_02365 [Enterobacter hormaechei]|uniref:hypothetical protein n=1 Tax=Enterobacter hormaechei TaxID=158836 RepID=UPI002020EC8E|nr:hypothetical protein [Enterobacter hormaechei]MCL8092708.1 hypothetical protein [Enterobacter hormaechei]MCM7337410.1 hypothetical protein [Enterobacter hormaechei]MCM8388593.1 hypothetical protein [Enterobacter hormaechei]MDA4637683.1 hypothetical protein [Enterobacter hormaechei]
MSTITKEWLESQISAIKVVGITDSNTLQAFEIALASLEAEAVGYMNRFTGRVFTLEEQPGADTDVNVYVPVYAAPPAPVSVPAAMEMDDDFDSAFEHGKAVGWNAYRAAMLQGADRPQNEPQNIPENIPATQFKPVADLYGLTSPTGGETSFTFDAVEARDFIDGGWLCQEYVELGRFQEAMLQNGNSPAQSDCCPEQNYIAPAQDGDSPVIPDGWVMVPEDPTHEMLEAGDEQFGTYDVYRRMIEAAPKLE